MSSYRQQIGNQKDTRRRFNNINDRQAYLNTMSEGQPSNNEGFNGQETVRYIKDKGVYHFIKRAGKWHSRLFTPAALTAQEEVDATVTVDTSDLEYDSLTISAGNGLSGGGSVALGSSTALDVNVDSSSLEISSDTIQVKDGGITESHLNSSVAGDGISGGAGTALAINLSEYSDVVPMSGDKFLTLDSDGSTEQLTTTDALSTLLAGDGLQSSSAVISVDISDFIGLGLLDDGSENIDVLFDGGYEDFDLSGADDSLITSAGATFVVADEPSVTTITPDASAASGSLNEAARSDHAHAIAAAAANIITPDAISAEGSSTSFSRADHAHAIATTAPGDLSVNLSASTEGTSTSFARADHTHDLDESITPLWTGLHTHNEDIYLYTGKKIYWVDSNQYISGDSADITIGSGGAINLTATTDVVVPVDVGVTFGTGEKIEGDDTDLTLTSGADINLTATDDVNIPVDVGLTWGDGGENIEGDNTDLTINAGTAINLKANYIDIGMNNNTDVKLEFLGDAGNGILRWMEDQDFFKFSDDVLIEGDEKLYIHSTAAYLYAATAGVPSIHPKLHIAAASNFPYTFGGSFTDSYRMRLDAAGQVYAMGEADYEANISALTIHDLQTSDYDTGFANVADSDWV